MRRICFHTSLIILAVLSIGTTQDVSAQKVLNLLSKGKILIGEQIIYTIKVEGITKGSIKEDFHFPDTANHIEFLSDSAQQIGADYVHTVTLTSFDSGTFQVPAFKMQLDDGRVLSTAALSITVLPADVSGLQDYHDIKDIIEIPLENDWWIVAVLVIATLISLFAILWLIAPVAQPVERTITTTGLDQRFQRLLSELASLDKMSDEHAGGRKQIVSMGVNLLREFIDAAKSNATAHLTTGEYMVFYKSRLPDATTESSFFQLMRMADAVKFARYEPAEEDVTTVLPVLRNTAEAIYHQEKRSA